MFASLSERLQRTIKHLRGQARLTDENIQDSMREVRIALLEADVALPVVKQFIDTVKEAARGQEVATSLNPGQAVIKVVNETLIDIMGKTAAPLSFQTTPPAIILMAGLQGSGKTTTVGKLAKYLTEREKKKVLVTSCDIYRPAAIDQLKQLATDLGIDYFPSTVQDDPVTIAQRAQDYAKKHFHDVLIIDTAGRLHVDDEMMAEIKKLHQAIQPIETLFVVDSMTGQDAANTAQAFNAALPITGVVLTKTDGDARGGAALSVKLITGKPIKFVGVGEKPDAFEVFHPDRIASRILGMGDILSLVEEVERKVDKEKSEKLAKKLRKGKGFDLGDFRDQLLQMNNMGGMMGMLSKMPGLGNMATAANAQMGEKSMKQTIAIINSMTEQERRFPALINGSRKKRIARGSGTDIPAINKLLKQFTQMQKMMKKFAKPGAMKSLLRGLGGMAGMGGMGTGMPGLGGLGSLGNLPQNVGQLPPKKQENDNE